MKSKNTLLIVLIIVLAMVAVVLVRNDKKQAEQAALLSSSSQPLTETEDGQLVAPSEISDSVSKQVSQNGDVDQIVNAILSDSAQDLEAAQAGDEDLDTLNQDNSLINPDDIYNANEF